MNTIMDIWNTFYFWAATQPVFLQVTIGISFLVVTIYLYALAVGLLFAFFEDFKI